MNIKKSMIRRAIALALALTVILVLPATAAASTFTSNQFFPIDIFVYVPCAAGGAGEYVELTGSLHDQFHVTFTAKGGFIISQLDNPQGIAGNGLTTGAKYQGTGETRFDFTGVVGFANTYVNNFKIIGSGPGNNFLIYETYHVTVNANGTLTAYVDNFSVTCQ